MNNGVAREASRIHSRAESIMSDRHHHRDDLEAQSPVISNTHQNLRYRPSTQSVTASAAQPHHNPVPQLAVTAPSEVVVQALGDEIRKPDESRAHACWRRHFGVKRLYLIYLTLMFLYAWICLQLFIAQFDHVIDESNMGKGEKFVKAGLGIATGLLPSLWLGAVLLSEDLVDKYCKRRFVPLAFATFIFGVLLPHLLTGLKVQPAKSNLQNPLG